MKVIRGGFGSRKTPSIGLVLGAGGVVGQAYQAGVLSALEREVGWDPREAAAVVGTSAGSVTAAALRVGVPATDLAASLYGVPPSRRGGAILRRILPADVEPLPTPSVGSLLRPWNLPSAALITRTIRRPLAFRPDVAAMTMLPAGMVDLTARAAPLHELVGERWPADLWICAVRRDDGGRVVFGREGSPPATLAAAVLASCAIPAYFAPVDIGGVQYFDGGVHSSTNADVLRRRPPDVVVVVSPMSARRFPMGPADGLIRWSTHRRLEREARRLERAGSVVVRIEPDAATIDAMGLRPMGSDRSDRVAVAAHEETVRLVAEGAIPRQLFGGSVRDGLALA